MKLNILTVSFLALLFTVLVISCGKDDVETPLVIEDFFPKSGGVGSLVQIYGKGFSTTSNKISFNGASASITSIDNGAISVKVPLGGSTGKITLTVGSQSATSSDDFTYLAPEINFFSPKFGSAGTLVAIAGSNFSSTLSDHVIKFNGVVATQPSLRDGLLLVKVPSGTDIGKITVQIGGLIGTSNTDFFYQKPVTVTKFAGDLLSGFSDGVSNARFNAPAGLATDLNGNVYVADSKNHAVRKIAPDGSVVTIAGNGTSGFVNATALSARFNEPYGVAVDGLGNVYVADTFNHSIRKINQTGVVTTIAGNGIAGFANGNGSSAQFDRPYGIAVDASGNIYIGERLRIRKISVSGDVTTLAGGSVSGFADGNGASAMFNTVLYLVFDGNGDLLATSNNRIRKITRLGIVTTLPSDRYNGSWAFALLGIAVDKSANVYVADNFSELVKITPSGSTGDYAGSQVSVAKDNNGNTVSLSNIFGLAIDNNGNLYVSVGIAKSNLIYKITL